MPQCGLAALTSLSERELPGCRGGILRPGLATTARFLGISLAGTKDKRRQEAIESAWSVLGQHLPNPS